MLDRFDILVDTLEKELLEVDEDREEFIQDMMDYLFNFIDELDKKQESDYYNAFSNYFKE
jgi:hypothetical protein